MASTIVAVRSVGCRSTVSWHSRWVMLPGSVLISEETVLLPICSVCPMASIMHGSQFPKSVCGPGSDELADLPPQVSGTHVLSHHGPGSRVFVEAAYQGGKTFCLTLAQRTAMCRTEMVCLFHQSLGWSTASTCDQ